MDQRLRRRLLAILAVGFALGLVVGVLVVGSGGSGRSDTSSTAPPTEGTGVTEQQAPSEGYVPSSVATLGERGCPLFPRDNVWHSVVDGSWVPLLPPEDPVASMVGATDGPVRAAFGADRGEGLNVVDDHDDPGTRELTFRVASNWLAPGNRNHARSTDADDAGLGPAGAPWFSMDLQSPDSGELRWSHMSLDPATDNRLYILDTETCVASEFIGFNGLLMRATGRLEANRLSQFDLRSNNRRLSRTWGEGPCPEVPPNPVFDPGCDGQTEKPASARGGSGLSGVAGLIRVDEVVDTGSIDHAISAVLPKNLVSSEQFVWPATVTDGSGGANTFDDAPAGSTPVPMGSRLRLRADFELPCDRAECPQASTIVDALKRHGVIVVDSMGPAEDLSAAGMHLVGEMSSSWDAEDLRSIESPGDPDGGMKLSDFEVVDAQDMRALPDATPQDDDWLRVR